MDWGDECGRNLLDITDFRRRRNQRHAIRNHQPQRRFIRVDTAQREEEHLFHAWQNVLIAKKHEESRVASPS